ncbi:ATP-binding protein [Fusobacterium gonidiaformans]
MNGAGKTTILDAISMVLCQIVLMKNKM